MPRHILLIFVVTLSLLILGAAFFSFSRPGQNPTQIYSGTVRRDCAPWDGLAFTLSIPVKGSSIHISIYQSPEINHLASFSFPDKTGRTGNSFYLPWVGSAEPLTGKVTFVRVEPGYPVKGEFRLKIESGKEFRGRFIAQWDDETAYCG
jgi:hypothetical protein